MSRVANFTHEHKLYLIQCIREFVNDVDDAQKDTATVLWQKDAWMNVTNGFNARFKAASYFPCPHVREGLLWSS